MGSPTLPKVSLRPKNSGLKRSPFRVSPNILYFHRLQIKPRLERLFCLPLVSALLFHVVEVEGQRVKKRTRIWPHWHVLPMEFSWSLNFAQKITEEFCRKSSEFLSRPPLLDAGELLRLVNEARRSQKC